MDITPVEDGIILEFEAYGGKGILNVTGRIENEIISKEPLQFPIANNYKHKNQINDFYSYKINTNYGKITVDGVLDEVDNFEIFTQEYQVPGSGHPAGDTYFWVMNDDENLYVTMDFTPDNTYDGDKDYAKVYVKNDEGIKEFKVSVPETTYGNAGFIYTDKVAYEHKVYEFAIPLSEIGDITDELELAFVGYGTASLPDVCLPRLAYDSDNGVYLSVYQKRNPDVGLYQIFGQFVYRNDSGTETVCKEFLISEVDANPEFPDVAYDIKNEKFLVVWEESHNKIKGSVIEVTNFEKDKGINAVSYTVNEVKTIYGTPGNVEHPAIAYDSDNGKFLIVCENRGDEDENLNGIMGIIVDISIQIENVFSIHKSSDASFPAVCYSDINSFLVVWIDATTTIQGRAITITKNMEEFSPETHNIFKIKSYDIGDGYVYAPSVAANNNLDLLVTWGHKETIYGVTVDIEDYYELSPKTLSIPNTYAHHSTSFYYGNNKMLCLWNENQNGEVPYGLIKMRTFYDGETSPLLRDDMITPTISGLESFNLIDSCGNGNGEILVAYSLFEEEVSTIGLLGIVEETYPIGYQFIGEFTPPDPYLEFVEDPYSVQLGKTIQAEVNYFDGEDDFDVTNYVGYNSADPEIATISTSGAITGVSVGTTTVSAIYVTGVNGSSTTYSAFANVIVSKRSESRPSPSPQKTIIGQIIVDGEVVKDIYAEDLVSDGGIYSFEATKTGDNARLWLLGSYYKQIANKNSSGTLQLIWDAASYNLPLKSEEVLKEVNNIAGSKVNIILEKVDDEKVIDSATVAVDKLGGKMVSGLVDFSVTVEGKSKEVNIDKYNMYVTRTMDNLNNLDAYNTTAMKLIEDEFTFAPSVFGNNAATIKYRGNGIFAIVNNPKSFSDIANHWSKMNVEKLAARNIAFGKNEGIFAPNDYVTRAEFAVMITRALAITEEEGTMNFEDVNGWYAEDISTAYDAGLINGRSDGKFYPNEKIQRKDMAVMIHNALKFAGKGEEVKNKDSVLSMFTDSSEIDEYAKESTAICADAGIIMGRDTKEFDPDENATRAEASAIIERMLRYLEFIN